MSSVLVTGANRGLGLEFVRQYAAEGWQVVAACRAPKAARICSNRRRKRWPYPCPAMDVTDVASVQSAAAALDGEAIDILLNNAGVGGLPGQRIGGLDYAAWAKVLDTNTLGPMRVVEAFLENVAQSRLKQVVTITSGMGSLEDNTSGGSYAYRSSKAAVNMVMKSLSIDLAPRGITFVVVNPGWVRTDMGGSRGTLSAEESIRSLRSVIAALRLEDSGKFLNYTGKPYPW